MIKKEETKELFEIMFFYTSKDMEDTTKELNKIQRLFARFIIPSEKTAMQTYNAVNKYNKMTASAIKEFAPLFETEFKDKYPRLNITQELKLFNTTLNILKCQWALTLTEIIDQTAAYYIKETICKNNNEKKLIKIYGNEYPKTEDIFEPFNSTIIKELVPEIDFIVDELINNRFGKNKRKSILNPAFKEEKDNIEYEKFNEMLELIPDENIIKLKEDYLKTVFMLFEEYLKIKNDAKKEINEKMLTVEKNFPEISEYAFKIAETFDKVINPITVQDNNLTDEQKQIKKRIEENFKQINSKEMSFIIFYMTEKEDPLSEMVMTTKNIISMLMCNLPVPGINSCLKSTPGTLKAAIEGDLIEIICQNPEEKIEDLKFKINIKNIKRINNSLKIQKPLNLNQFINNMTGIVNLLEENDISKELKKMLTAGGLNEEKSQQLSLIISLGYIIGVRTKELKINKIKLRQNQKNLDFKEDKSSTSPQTLQSPTDEKTQAEHQKLKDENENLKQKNLRLELKIKELKEYIKKETNQKAKEMANDFLLELIDKDLEIQEEEPDISFPQFLNKKVVVFGGHETWVNHMKEFLPGVIYVNKDKNPDEQLIRNADSVWIQTNAISHTFYHKVANIIKNTGFKNIKFCGSSSASDCARRIYLEERE